MAYEIQKSFAAGEISDKSQLRSDKDLFKHALKRCRNSIPTPHGPGRSRYGFDYVAEVPSVGYCRLFEFKVSKEEAYVIIMTTSFVYIATFAGLQFDTNYLVNGNFSDGHNGWNSQSTIISQGVAKLIPNLYAPATDAWIEQAVTPANGALLHTIEIQGIGINGSTGFSLEIGTFQGGSDILQVNGEGEFFSTTFTPNFSPFWVRVTVGKGQKDITFMTIYDSNSAVIQLISPYTQDQDLIELQNEKVPGEDTMFFVTRAHPPQEVIYTDPNTWVIQAITFDYGIDPSNPPTPYPPPWGNFWPGSLAFHDGRLFLGGTTFDTNFVWGSKPQLYRNFDIGDPANQLPDDALELPMNTAGEIQWLRGNKKYLFVGLDTGEHTMFGINGPLATDNADTDQESSYGSSRVHAIVAHEDIAYIDLRSRKVRIMQYSENEQGQVSQDISFDAEHITKGIIREMQFGYNPIGTFIFPTLSGDLVCANLEKDQGTLGWYLHDTQGLIVSSTILRESGTDVKWIAVVRDNGLFIERESFEAENFCDSAYKSTVDEASPTVQFFGFDHLIGQTIQIVADGSVQTDKVVQPDGSITLDYPAVEVIGGLGFNALIETLPEQRDSDAGGNTRAFMKRNANIFLYLLNSPRPIVNGTDTYKRFAVTPMDSREEARTEILDITSLGWTRDASIIIEQPLPIDMNIAGVGSKLAENKK